MAMPRITLLVVMILLSGGALSEGAKWKNPWAESDKDMYTLVQDGFRVVDSTFTSIEWGKKAIEIVYLEKGKEYYRCLTLTAESRIDHGCEQLVRVNK